METRRLWLDEKEMAQSDTKRRLEEAKKALEEREAIAKASEANLSRSRESLGIREQWVRNKEAELAKLADELKAERLSLDQQVGEAAQKTVEELRAEQRAGVQRIAAWAGEISTALVPLGLSPIQVPEPSSTLSDALPVLDSTVEQFRGLEPAIEAQLEAEGRQLCREVAEHILVCFRSHSPNLSLEPVVVGPVADALDAARESVKEVVETVVARFQRIPEGETPPPPDLQ